MLTPKPARHMPQAADTPNYTHDCSRCEFLGWARVSDGITRDLYFCSEKHRNVSEVTNLVVARFGNNTGDYRSWTATSLEQCPFEECRIASYRILKLKLHLL